MKKEYIKWCNGHYTLETCKEVKKQIREQGYKCITKDYIKENGVSYARVYIEVNDAYIKKEKAITVKL